MAALVVAVGLIAGCGSAGEGGEGPGSGDGSSAEQVKELERLLAIVDGPAETRNQAIAGADAAFTEAFLADTGLDELLTIEETQRAFDAVTEQLRGVVPQDLGIGADGKFVARTARSRTQGEPDLPPGSLSSFTLGGIELLTLGTLGIDLLDTGQVARGTAADDYEIDVRNDGFSVAGKHSVVVKGVEAKLANSLAVNTCPDAKGVVKVKARIDTSMYRVGSREGGRAEIDIDVTAQVGDDAEQVSEDFGYRVQVSDTRASGRGKFVDFSAGHRETYQGGTTEFSNIKDVVPNRSSNINQKDFESYYNDTRLFVLLLKSKIMEGLERRWKSGRCIDLKVVTSPAKRTGLEPSAAVEVTATPIAKSDGAMAGGTVVATLEGGSSLSPGGKVKAVASYSYRAPDTKGKTASISFESRSKRGVGKAKVDFDTKQTRYTASGGGAGLSVSGTIEDITKPFTLNGTIPGGQVVLTYTPSSDQGGSYTDAISGSGVTGSVTGTYTLSGTPGEVLILTGQDGGCINGVPGSCRNNTMNVTLTPAA